MRVDTKDGKEIAPTDVHVASRLESIMKCASHVGVLENACVAMSGTNLSPDNSVQWLIATFLASGTVD